MFAHYFAMIDNPDYQKYLQLFPAIQEYQKLADKYNIADIFQDNGGKYVQLLILLGLKTSGRREGNDAVDEHGREYEIKTVNMELTRSFSTHHHMNPVIITKYRGVDWFFAVYSSIALQVIYKMTPEKMEPYYTAWWEKWHDSGGKDINNPKIPLKYVMQNGELMWLNPELTQFVPSPLVKRPSTPRVQKIADHT